MNDVDVAVAVNPFEDNVIGQPRAVRYSVPGLNDRPLNALLEKFSRLTVGALPRQSISVKKAQLIISPEPGYGKSHLLGRLFQKLGAEATKIYLRPFQDPQRVWSSILLTTVQELELPNENTSQSGTQLEAFALGVLAHVAADFITETGAAKHEPAKKAIRHLREHPLEVLGPRSSNKFLVEWLHARLDDPSDLVRLAELLQRHGVQLHGREKAWLKVLAGYAFSGTASVERDAARTWLRGEPLEADQVRALHLAAADNDGGGDASAREINDLCLRRLRGLCLLSSFFRPFVFCFDQTEFYGRDCELVNALGSCIEELHSAAIPNHLTVVTSNANNWANEIAPQMTLPYLARFSDPIELDGINQDQARELLAARLGEFDCNDGIIAEFIEPHWLSSLFVQKQIGVRKLLIEAAERFRTFAGAPAQPNLSIDGAFDIEINKVRAKPSLQQYSQDCLMWFVEVLAEDYQGVDISRPRQKYFSLEWKWPDRSIYFAFEAGHHNARWRAIANEAIRLAAAGKRVVTSIVFRTPDLKPVPAPSWDAARRIIDEAQKQGLRIVSLTIDQVCELHAAREFYSSALQGNVQFNADEVLRFLRARFVPWLNRYSEAHRSSPVPKPRATKSATAEVKLSRVNGRQSVLTPDQIETVVNYMRERRLVDVEEVLRKLGGHTFKNALLKEVENHPNLKAHAGPQAIVLQWRV